LSNVIEEVSYYTNNVIVVNDGSTDNTENILNKFSTITVLSIKQNTGKGNALKKGFEIARDKGYEYEISIDSDGQHFAEDLPKFIEIIEQEPEAIVLGARNMTQEGIPGKSSFGNKFSNFWFRIETGIKHPDTQSGYRLYPIKLLEKMHFFTKKFEFEIEVIVRAAWNGVKVVFIPIKIYYSPKEKRISHFRPFRDFARISVLNTCLVLIALIYARPFNFIKKLNKKNVKYFIKNNLLNPEESNIRKAIAVSFGIFMGILPVWGYQLILAIVLAHVFKLNKFIVIVTANISIPPMIPFVLFASFKTGGIILGSKASHLSFISGITFETVKNNLYQYLIGSLVFGFLLSILCGLLTYLILRFFKRKIAASI